MNKALEVRDLRYHYTDGTEALRGVSFAVEAGECVGIIGPNGAGNSTLLLHLNGILPDAPPHANTDPGTVVVDGVAVDKANLAHVRRRVGLLFQDADDQIFCPTVYEDVAFGSATVRSAAGGDCKNRTRRAGDCRAHRL